MSLLTQSSKKSAKEDGLIYFVVAPIILFCIIFVVMGLIEKDVGLRIIYATTALLFMICAVYFWYSSKK